MLLTSYNYKILVMGVLLVLLGFGGMYIESQQYGVYSLFIGPILVITGFILVAISVFKTDPEVLENERQNQSASGSESNKSDTPTSA